jgi:hypothetical protein
MNMKNKRLVILISRTLQRAKTEEQFKGIMSSLYPELWRMGVNPFRALWMMIMAIVFTHSRYGICPKEQLVEE